MRSTRRDFRPSGGSTCWPAPQMAHWPAGQAGRGAGGAGLGSHDHEERWIDVQQPGGVAAQGRQVEQAGQDERLPGQGGLASREPVGTDHDQDHGRPLDREDEAHRRPGRVGEWPSGHDSRGAAEQDPAARAEAPPAPGRQHREYRGGARELQCGQAQRGPGGMLSGLGGEQDAVLHRPDQPGRRVRVAGPPPGVPEVREVAGQAGQPGQQSPPRRRQEVTHRPALACTRMKGALRKAGRR
jgi:hypothetical protein